MAIAPAVLTVKLEVDNSTTELRRVEREALASARKIEQNNTAETSKGETQRANVRKMAAVKQEIEDAKALQKQRLSWEKHYNSLAITEEKARLRSLKGQESWSARMTKSIDSVAFAVKGFALAWATAQVSSMVKGSLELAGGMRDMAAGVQLSTQQYFALTSALRDAGVQAEKIDPMFTRLNDLISGGANEKQATILSKLGIDATGMTNVQLMDTLLGKINGRLITQADLGELVGTRIVPAWNRLANEITNVNEANAKYKFPLTDAEVDALDEASRMWESMSVNISLATAKGALWATETQNALALAPSWAGPFIFALDNIIERQEKARNSAHLFAGFLGGAQADINARRNFAANGPYSLPEQVVRPGRLPDKIDMRPVDAQGNRLRRFNPQQADRSFALPSISQELPTVTRATEEWNEQLKFSVSLAQQVEFSVSQFANSSTWQVAQAGAQAFTSIMSLQAQSIQNEVDGLNRVMEMERERWQIRSEAMREAGQEGSAAYRNELKEFERLDAQRAKKAQQLQAKAFEVNKRAQIAGTIMNTGQAIMNALATVKPFLPVGLIMAALAGAQGGVQVATIAGQQNPYKGYAFGGYVPGQSLGDDTMINVTGGEFVNNRESTKANRAALEYANRGGILRPEGSGGITVIIQGDIVGDDAYVENRLIPKLQKAIDRGYRLQTR